MPRAFGRNPAFPHLCQNQMRPKTFAESITSEFVSVYSDYCGTQRQMTETLQKKRSFDPEFKENLKTWF